MHVAVMVPIARTSSFWHAATGTLLIDTIFVLIAVLAGEAVASAIEQRFAIFEQNVCAAKLCNVVAICLRVAHLVFLFLVNAFGGALSTSRISTLLAYRAGKALVFVCRFGGAELVVTAYVHRSVTFLWGSSRIHVYLHRQQNDQQSQACTAEWPSWSPH